MSDLKFDPQRGLYVPPGTPVVPAFPPRFDLPADTKHPTRVDGVSSDRGMNTNSAWGDNANWPPKPQAREVTHG